MQLLTAAMVCLVLVTAMKTLSRNEVSSNNSPPLLQVMYTRPPCTGLELRPGSLYSGCKGQSEQCQIAQ